MTTDNKNDEIISFLGDEMDGDGGRAAAAAGVGVAGPVERPLASDTPHNPPEFSGGARRRLAGLANQNWGTGVGPLDCGHPIQWLVDKGYLKGFDGEHCRCAMVQVTSSVEHHHDLSDQEILDMWKAIDSGMNHDSTTTDELDEARVHLIGQLYETLNYHGERLADSNSFRLEAVQIIIDTATTDERLLHRLVAIDGRNGAK